MKRLFGVFGCAALGLAGVGLLWISRPEALASSGTQPEVAVVSKADSPSGTTPVPQSSAYGASAEADTAMRKPSSAHTKPLAVGLNYVVPPFVPGAKPRTPESPDETLAAQLAEKLGAEEVDARRISAGSVPADIAEGEVDIALLPLSSGRQQALSDAGMAIVPTGYVARPMAIMRSDTDIKSWEQLKGRTVCLSEGGLYTGHIASQYGAVELVKRAPADSLLALRTGGCDAAVHDAYMLNTLLAYPEWKKFSATLPPGPKMDLVFVAPRDNAKAVAALHSLTRSWRGKHYLDELNKTRVRDIAFEVYLDQEVPDCH